MPTIWIYTRTQQNATNPLKSYGTISESRNFHFTFCESATHPLKFPTTNNHQVSSSPFEFEKKKLQWPTFPLHQKSSLLPRHSTGSKLDPPPPIPFSLTISASSSSKDVMPLGAFVWKLRVGGGGDVPAVLWLWNHGVPKGSDFHDVSETITGFKCFKSGWSFPLW